MKHYHVYVGMPTDGMVSSRFGIDFGTCSEGKRLLPCIAPLLLVSEAHSLLIFSSLLIHRVLSLYTIPLSMLEDFKIS